ncbi:serine kinase of HPr protein (carbohydrate metabolism regulator) [Sphingomonas jinjuensis]|uniref:Serine kinase of HPr protein (Carbohydrate metabolism regulator) n=1 Tax=Sphingomonas jinjuensis TaxID=535907 RepID=A0A840FBS1_9SPHN|nr:HPr kinase/phosphatase C-terminal domain-containing protein [Sphingomonas jinjuensis]MBB4154092.1 serine kinase of HPr protein (carbohydrate metabolism regulator) [Sphingomonas jinjuensis]
MSDTVHATCVAIHGRAVLIEGRSGTGKSDLALRLIDRGAVLVGDDRVRIEAAGGRLVAHAVPTIAGRIEVRGVGIATLPFLAEAPVALLVMLGAPVKRLPEPMTRRLAGVDIPAIALDAFEASTPIKIELALRQPEAILP